MRWLRLDGRRRSRLGTLQLAGVFLLLVCVQAKALDDEHLKGPELLDMSELKAVANRVPPPATQAKLEILLNTPFISNSIPPESTDARSPREIRVIEWNIARGLQLELIRLALENPAEFQKREAADKRISTKRWQKAERELDELRRADILILNEVDFGLKRTGYANVAAELAEAARMNYTFGVEFLEVDHLYTGDERIQMNSAELTQELANDFRVDPARWHGMHGNAILSRFPIISATIERLPECYDWYGAEIDGISRLEQGKRAIGTKLFAERVRRQVRRGGRMMLMAKLDAGLPGDLTVVATHLEDRSTPACRRRQMIEVLTHVIAIPGPLIIGGDLNTSTADGTPTSIKYEIKKRISNPRFWASQGIRWFTPLALPFYVTWPGNFFKNFHDPSALHVPFFARNRERLLFKDLRSFRFADGSQLDFAGDPRRSGNGHSRTLSDSNERVWKGFAPTFHLERNYLGLTAYRLDWLLVKTNKDDSRPDVLLAYSPKTLTTFNELGKEQLSDHQPIVLRLRSPWASDVSLSLRHNTVFVRGSTVTMPTIRCTCRWEMP